MSPILLSLTTMITIKRISEILESIVKNTDYFVVGIALKPGNKIVIEVDRMAGININDCAVISRKLEKELNRDIEDFALEVSSPGLGSHFKVKQQFIKNLNRNINIHTTDNKKFIAVLKEVKEDSIICQVKTIVKDEKNKKQEIFQNIELNFNQLKSVKGIIDFK